MTEHWTLKEALELIRCIQVTCHSMYNYHICLGGGVLNKGESEKDLDLYFLPMNNEKEAEPNKLIEWLETMWDKSESVGRAYGVTMDTQEGTYGAINPIRFTNWPLGQDVAPEEMNETNPDVRYEWRDRDGRFTLFRVEMRGDDIIQTIIREETELEYHARLGHGNPIQGIPAAIDGPDAGTYMGIDRDITTGGTRVTNFGRTPAQVQEDTMRNMMTGYFADRQRFQDMVPPDTPVNRLRGWQYMRGTMVPDTPVKTSKYEVIRKFNYCGLRIDVFVM